MAIATPPQQAAPAKVETKSADPAKLFQRGQDALTLGRLEEAERDFRQVLQLDPQAGGAYANLGVVYMLVLNNQWYARFYDALQNKDQAVFWREIVFFCWIAAAYIVIAAPIIAPAAKNTETTHPRAPMKMAAPSDCFS